MKLVFADSFQVMHFDGNQFLSLELAPVFFRIMMVGQEKTTTTTNKLSMSTSKKRSCLIKENNKESKVKSAISVV